MNEENPYSAPASPIIADAATSEDFTALDDQQLKKLYYRSCNVSGIALLMALGLIITGVIFVSMGTEKGTEALGGSFGIILTGVQVIAMFGIIQRTNWGRYAGLLVCVMALLAFPLGTLIGIVGLVAFLKAPNLFGIGRVTHKQLHQEFKKRKREAKETKKAAKAARKAT